MLEIPEDPKTPEEIEELVSLIIRICQQITLPTRCYLTKQGLSMARFTVLGKLSPSQPLSMGDLQRCMQLAPGTLTGLVDGLVEAGLVQRWRDDQDRRLVFLTLTAAGSEALQKVFQYRAAVVNIALAGQQEVDISRLNAELGHILTLLNRRESRPPACSQGEARGDETREGETRRDGVPGASRPGGRGSQGAVEDKARGCREDEAREGEVREDNARGKEDEQR